MCYWHSQCVFVCVRSLDVSGCKAVTDAGVRSLALGCRRLEQLDLSSTGTGNRGYDATECFSTSTVNKINTSLCTSAACGPDISNVTARSKMSQWLTETVCLCVTGLLCWQITAVDTSKLSNLVSATSAGRTYWSSADAAAGKHTQANTHSVYLSVILLILRCKVIHKKQFSAFNCQVALCWQTNQHMFIMY